jgi:hypothetical protein
VLERHYLKSSFREKLIEHLFIGELLKLSWTAGTCSLEIAKPEVDYQGYDLVAEENGIIRHIQLKTSRLTARASRQKVHIALATKPSGCVVWIYFNERTLVLGPFLFFGGAAGEPLPYLSDLRVARHTKGDAQGIKAERPDIRWSTGGNSGRLTALRHCTKCYLATDDRVCERRHGLVRPRRGSCWASWRRLGRARRCDLGRVQPGHNGTDPDCGAKPFGF